MQINWTTTELKFLADNSDLTIDELTEALAAKFTISPGTDTYPCFRTKNAILRRLRRNNEQAAETKTQPMPTDLTCTEQIQAIVKKHSERHYTDYKGVNVGKITTKILSLSDIHLPLTDMDLINRIVKEHADSDIVVLNGDIIDGYSFSTFPKESSIPAIDEYRAAFDFVKMLSIIFPKVVIVDGNHDVRAAKIVSKYLSGDQASIFNPNLLERIVNGEELDQNGKLIKKHEFKNVIYERTESWYVKIGKTIFAHPYGMSGSAPGAAATKAHAKFLSRYTAQEYDSLVVGHTHKIYKGVINSHLLIEQGCLAGFLSYAFSPSSSHNNNYMKGYALIYQDAEGNTDFNLSGPIYEGVALPPKKGI